MRLSSLSTVPLSSVCLRSAVARRCQNPSLCLGPPGKFQATPVSAKERTVKGADCGWPHKSRTRHDPQTPGAFAPGPVRIAVTCDQGARRQLLDLLQVLLALLGRPRSGM